MEEQDAVEVQAWLAAPDASTKHASACELHQPGTCTWLVHHDPYMRWKAGETKHLWLNGKPGCGKSVLCSKVIEDLHLYRLDNGNVAITYFYFTFSEDRKQSYDDMLLGLVAQLGENGPARATLRQLHERSKQTKLGTQELQKIFISTVSAHDEAIVVLDALDESPDPVGTPRELFKRLRD